MSCVILLEERGTSFLQTSPYMPFPLADFALYPFAIINHSPKYNYMLCPVSLSNELITEGGGREPTH